MNNHRLAKLISTEEYLALNNPEFIGQTSANSEGQYKMYWRVDKEDFYTENKL